MLNVDSLSPKDPALGLIESSSIARGLKAADAMVKKSPINLARCYTVSPGKHLNIITGGVDEVLEAMREGEEITAPYIVDRLFLPQIHLSVLAALRGEFSQNPPKSLGILEFLSVASTLLAADAATKAAEVELIELRLGAGLGGKGYFILSGELHMLEAGVEAGVKIVKSEFYCAHEIIPAPHEEFCQKLPNRRF